LVSVTIESIDNSRGEHFRNFTYTGADAEGNTVNCTTRLRLSHMDLRVHS
jgi:hypothetical protein